MNTGCSVDNMDIGRMALDRDKICSDKEYRHKFNDAELENMLLESAINLHVQNKDDMKEILTHASEMYLFYTRTKFKLRAKKLLHEIITNIKCKNDCAHESLKQSDFKPQRCNDYLEELFSSINLNECKDQMIGTRKWDITTDHERKHLNVTPSIVDPRKRFHVTPNAANPRKRFQMPTDHEKRREKFHIATKSEECLRSSGWFYGAMDSAEANVSNYSTFSLTIFRVSSTKFRE